MFWRFGARIFSPIDGYWESIFRLRTAIGQIEMMAKVGMRDEVVPLRFRHNRVHGSLHCCRTGVISMVVHALDIEAFGGTYSKNSEIFATEQNDLVGGVQDREERY
jgi:hypothetical protein